MPIPAPKPIAVTGGLPANFAQDAPQSFVIVAAGYDATKTQMLQHVNGVAQWVTVTP